MKTLEVRKGRLLIAEPSILNDQSFNRAIILLTECTPKSVVGFILNRPLAYTINDLLPEINCHFTIYEGGPVEQDNLYFVHNVPHLIPNSVQVSSKMYWGGNFDSLKNLLINKQLKSNDIRFFLGYTGWGKQQLNKELSDGTWFVSENDFENIFATDEGNLWKNKLLEKGGEYKIWANAPNDINLN